MFKRILIANRGEIALRIIRACKEMGIGTVAVYSEADRGAPYLDLADEAICIGPARSSESYLKIDRIISAAEIGDVDAIHPGYGFLAENAHFADVCRSCRYEFIGPTSDAMALVGDKNSARSIAKQVGVPCVPGSDGLISTESEALDFARKVGFPVLIKASAGGGGRGMRVARDEAQLRTAITQASQEASAAFGNGDIYLEKFIDGPRHVEAQIVADKHGNVVHLWERDCSMQRRHQKLVEESPAPNLKLATRKALCEAATRLVKAADYFNAGTVEFLVDKDENFYFIEMNARIQVEHPVTELVTGIDLIKTQILVAAGEPLPFEQQDIVHRGASIECRINAEDPEHHFRPCPGTITQMIVPGGFGVRFDSHAHAGYTVGPTYDSMIGKLLVHQPTRREAIDSMIRCLNEMRIEGIKTSIPIQLRILESPDFQEGRIDTGFIERML
ncbi:MAG TPA: acetyl-CoA carboxylase biotin carboxylase subunit [Planctomycetaceae bacterium]|nr:acetyl-CoA carboxylase biotin carboxylase subunit [Planctomycetaceae bacterium]